MQPRVADRPIPPRRARATPPWAVACCVVLSSGPLPAIAQTSDGPTAPIGVWATIDDHTHKRRSLVEISEHDGVLSGRIIKLFQEPGEDPNPRCEDCKGERHGQPVLGMTILWNLHRDGDAWDGGEILDPETGSIYRVTIHPAVAGTKLEVRGYVGVSLLGRTQVWERAAAS